MQDTNQSTASAAGTTTDLPPARRPQSLPFTRSERSTLGVEWELALIDRDSLDLRQCAEEILQKVGPDPHVHGEMMLNTIELVSGARRSVAECVEDIALAFDRVLPGTPPLPLPRLGSALARRCSRPGGRQRLQGVRRV